MKAKKKEAELFKPEGRLRRKNGQFATPEMAYADKHREQNRYLTYQLERQKRLVDPTEKENIRLRRELEEWKVKYNTLVSNIQSAIRL